MAEKYKNKKQFNMKNVILIGIAIAILALLITLTALASIMEKNKQNEIEISTGNFSSIKNILEYYGCKYKGEKSSELDGFYLDIYAVFKYDLYEDEKSNEKFYNNVIDKIAEFLNYNSFRLIDTSREEKIEIQVICDKTKIKTIYINGIEDYFIYMDSKFSLSKYKKLDLTEISVQSQELQNCISSNWSSDVDFGSRDAIFQNYYIYFDEGIEVRKIQGKIFNIIFTKNYGKPVVNGFTIGEKYDIIIDRMGEPTFQNEDRSIIGYKSKDIYVFFENDQISVYRNIAETGFDDFFELADKFLDKEYSLLEFMNELTYLWPDYEEYTYSQDMVYLSYPNKGIDIKINYDDTDGIILYNNIGVSQDIVNKYLEHTEFVAELQVDDVFNTECKRVKKINGFANKCKEYQEKYEAEDTRNRGNIYNYYVKMDSNEKIIAVYFIPNSEQYTKCELQDSIDTYIWLNEYCFLYSIQGKGIYYYDLKNQTKGVITTGIDNFEIKSYENQILTYDETQLQITY